MADQITEWATNDLLSTARLNDYRAHSLHVQPATAGMVGIKVWRRDAAETADLFQARSEADADLFAIEDDGAIRLVDVVMRRGAANRLDLESGDRLVINSGSIAVNSPINTFVINGATFSPAYLSYHTSTDFSIAGIAASSTDAVSPVVGFMRSRGSIGSPSVVASGDRLGFLGAFGYDGVDYAESCEILFEVDGTTGSDIMPGRIRFLTTPSGSNVPSERLRISADGSLRIFNAIDHDGTTVGLYGVTPVVRAGAIAAPVSGIFVDNEARAAINSIRTALTNIGITS